MGCSNTIFLTALLVTTILRTSKPNSSHCKPQPSKQKPSPSLPQNKNVPFGTDRWNTCKERARGVPAVKN